MTGLGKKAYEYTADAAADAALRQRLASLQWLTLDDLQVPESVRNETVLALAQNEVRRPASGRLREAIGTADTRVVRCS